MICTDCKEDKPVENFYRSSYSTSGLLSACTDCQKARNRQYYANNKSKYAAARRLAAYRLAEEDFIDLLEDQGYTCAICQASDKLVVDHSHSSNKVRGLLCNKCNVGLGCFQDSPQLLAEAERYLRDNP
jgi:hypothetical protein